MLSLLAALSLSSAALAYDDPTGPWRQLIRFQPSETYQDGISLWVTDAAVLPPEGPRSRDTREAQDLWVAHGAAVGGQAYVIKTNRYDCADGAIYTDRVAAYGRDGRFIAAGIQSGEPGYPQTHSAEAEAYYAICSGSRIAAAGALAKTTAEAVAVEGPGREIETATELRYDVDYDGEDDTIRISMRPHSMRHDVEIVLAKQANRPINIIAAQQPPTGPLVHRKIRPLERDRYLIACMMEDGRDVAPCQADYVLAQRGVEIVTPDQPTILVWLTLGEPHVARLP